MPQLVSPEMCQNSRWSLWETNKLALPPMLCLTVSCITIHRKNFRFPYREIPVIFPKFGEKLGKNWENISQMWENFGTLYSLLVPIEGFFWEKKTIIFWQLNFGKITGFFPILGKRWDIIFLQWENIRKNIGNILSWKQIQNCYVGEILGCVNNTQFSPNLFVFGTWSSKRWENIGKRTYGIYWANPNLRKDWDIPLLP